MRKTCGNCQHFTHEPNTPSRGVCWHSAEFDYYVVRGEHYKGCDDWTKRTEVSEVERKAALWDGIVRCRDCKHYDADAGFCTRFKEVIDDHCDLDWPYQIPEWDYLESAPNGYCAWGKRREDA